MTSVTTVRRLNVDVTRTTRSMIRMSDKVFSDVKGFILMTIGIMRVLHNWVGPHGYISPWKGVVALHYVGSRVCMTHIRPALHRRYTTMVSCAHVQHAYNPREDRYKA